MTEIPKRLTLVAQTADILRGDIQRGEWTDTLPGEIPLCERLQVSRITLRAALKILQREGLIEVQKGHQRRITPKARVAAAPPRPKLVGLLTTVPLYEIPPYAMFQIGELRRHLHDAGYALEILADPRFARRQPRSILENLVPPVRVSCWILHQSTPAIQQWFQHRRLRALILGSALEGIECPSIDIHHRAVSNHAVGVLLRLGHRSIALLMPKEGGVGDRECERGFREAFETAQKPGPVPHLFRHEPSVNGVRASLAAALRAQPKPSALLLFWPEDVLTVLGLLGQEGLRVPQDISVISLSDEGYLARVIPAVARYRLNRKAYVEKFQRMVLQLATTGALATRQVREIPRFFPGATVARPRLS